MRKLFLFDLDGTLVTTGGAGLRALNRAFEDVFGRRNAVEGYSPSGKTDPAIFRELARLRLRRALKEDEKKSLGDRYLALLEEEMAPAPARVLRGVQDFVSSLLRRDDALIALGTGNLEKGARLKLGRTGLNEMFSVGGFGSDAEDRADVLRAGHRKAEESAQTSIPNDAVFVIGDTCLDVKAARRAGYRAVAVASGVISYADLANANPDFLLSDLTHGSVLLDRLSSLSTVSA